MNTLKKSIKMPTMTFKLTSTLASFQSIFKFKLGPDKRKKFLSSTPFQKIRFSLSLQKEKRLEKIKTKQIIINIQNTEKSSEYTPKAHLVQSSNLNTQNKFYQTTASLFNVNTKNKISITKLTKNKPTSYHPFIETEYNKEELRSNLLSITLLNNTPKPTVKRKDELESRKNTFHGHMSKSSYDKSLPLITSNNADSKQMVSFR